MLAIKALLGSALLITISTLSTTSAGLVVRDDKHHVIQARRDSGPAGSLRASLTRRFRKRWETGLFATLYLSEPVDGTQGRTNLLAGACGLSDPSNTYQTKYRNDLDPVALPSSLFDQYGASYANTLCGKTIILKGSGIAIGDRPGLSGEILVVVASREFGFQRTMYLTLLNILHRQRALRKPAWSFV